MTTTSVTAVRTATLDTQGEYDLREVALMGFGHRDERSWDGVMRLAFCVDGALDEQVGVEVRQVAAETLELTVHDRPGRHTDLDTVTAQVARIVSVDHDGRLFAAVCAADPVLDRVRRVAPGFRPTLFHSPYEAALWSVISARRARPQAITLRARLAAAHGHLFDLAGVTTAALPGPAALAGIGGFAGLPVDRMPRLHAIAVAAAAGRLDIGRLTSLTPEAAKAELQVLPGIGPFYSTLIVVRACGLTDVLAPEESRSRELIGRLYGLGHLPDDAELAAVAEGWRPYRTWATVLLRALSGRLPELAQVTR